MVTIITMFVNKISLVCFIIIVSMANKQVVSKGFRVSEEADEILKEVSKRDFRDFPTIVRLALLEYVQKRHEDLSAVLAEEFTPQ
jgi:predicted DNA-binding protein